MGYKEGSIWHSKNTCINKWISHKERITSMNPVHTDSYLQIKWASTGWARTMPFPDGRHVGFWFMSQSWLCSELLGLCTWINGPVFNLGVSGHPAGRHNWGKGGGRCVPWCTVVGLLGHFPKGVLQALETPQRELSINHSHPRRGQAHERKTPRWRRVAWRRWGKQTKHPFFMSHFSPSCLNFLF